MKQWLYFPIVTVVILWALGLSSSPAATYTWKTATTGDWFTAANWTNASGYPADGDDVVITNAGAGVLLTNNTAQLSSFVLGGAAGVNTLTFSNWDTLLSATNITILTNGTLTCAGPFTNNAMSNRVYLSCSNLIMFGGGKIDVNGLGYRGGTGTANMAGSGPAPGWGAFYVGASHGGLGGSGMAPYGSLTAPETPGSGGGCGTVATWAGGNGGGVVRINAPSGKVVINGSISADASVIAPAGVCSTGGSGGSIYITCQAFTGTNGAISANGSAGAITVSGMGGGGGGGRIAVIYSSIEPAATSVTFSVTGAIGGRLDYIELYENSGDIGTLYFPDSQLLTPTITKLSGQWWALGFTNWSVDSLTVSNVWIRFPRNGFQLTVTNDVLITGSSGRLELGGDQAWTNNTSDFNWVNGYSPWFPYTSANGPTLQVGGNLTVTNGGQLWIYAGMTNAPVQDHGALVDVAGNIRIAASNSWICPVAQMTNGATVLFRARDVTIDKSSGFNADKKGYQRAFYPFSTNWGYGPGKGYSSYIGAGYGGVGGGSNSAAWGIAGLAYGNSNAPILPGSGSGSRRAGYQGAGAFGGGAVRLSVSGTITLDGMIKANGESGWKTFNNEKSGGSGGGICLTCKTFIGSTNGILQANGGNAANTTVVNTANGGGGGRIAVWRIFDRSSGLVSNYVNGGSSAGVQPAYGPGTNGTVVWGWLPPAGMIIRVR